MDILFLITFIVGIFSIILFSISIILLSRRRRVYHVHDIKIITIIIIEITIMIAIILSLFNAPSGIFRTPNPIGVPVPTPTPPLIVNLNPSSLEIVTDAPTSMIVHQSYVVKVSLVPKGQSIISSIKIEKATATATDATPVGTPGTTLKNALGPGYKPVAYATLEPSEYPFMITSIPPVEQSLEQREVLWKWTVVPLEPGEQILDVDIEIIWKATKGNNQQGPYRIGDKQLNVEVAEPTPTPMPTSAPMPIPTPTLLPTPTPTPTPISRSASSVDSLQIAANIAQIGGIIWMLIFGGVGMFEVVGNRTGRRPQLPSALTITNILLAAIFLVLVSLFFHPTLLPLPHIFP